MKINDIGSINVIQDTDDKWYWTLRLYTEKKMLRIESPRGFPSRATAEQNARIFFMDAIEKNATATMMEFEPHNSPLSKKHTLGVYVRINVDDGEYKTETEKKHIADHVCEKISEEIQNRGILNAEISKVKKS